MIELKGHQDFRYRLVLSTLSAKPIRITDIRPDDVNPGLKDYEVSFLRLLESITNGGVMEISYTGTTIIYKPGLISGGAHTHICPVSRAVGYFIEPLLLLAPFAKKPTTVTLRGVTSNDLDAGVDLIRTVYFPALSKLGIDNSELRIVRRGSPPQGGGEVVLSIPHCVLQPKTLHATQPNQVARIRGVSFSTRVSPASVTRCIESARAVLKATEVETFIYADVTKGAESGSSPGFGITLVAETRSGWPIGAQGFGAAGQTPEDLGAEVAKKLLYEISVRGAVSRPVIPMVLTLMVLGSEDIGRILIGEKAMSARVVSLLRLFNVFWGGTQVIANESEEGVNFALKGLSLIHI